MYPFDEPFMRLISPGALLVVSQRCTCRPHKQERKPAPRVDVALVVAVDVSG